MPLGRETRPYAAVSFPLPSPRVRTPVVVETRARDARLARTGRVGVIIDWSAWPDMPMEGYAHRQKDPPLHADGVWAGMEIRRREMAWGEVENRTG
jgi:hypothetical protein